MFAGGMLPNSLILFFNQVALINSYNVTIQCITQIHVCPDDFADLFLLWTRISFVVSVSITGSLIILLSLVSKYVGNNRPIEYLCAV